MWNKTTEPIGWDNSYKMKFAIIAGIVQMSFGVFLKGMNNIYYHNWLDFFTE